MSIIKNSTYQVSLLSLGHFLSDFYCNFLPILLPLIMPKLGLSLTLSGILVMVFSFTSNVLQPFFGYLIDRHNLNRLLLVVIPSGAIFICSTGYVHSTVALFLVIAISGIAVSCYHPLASNLVSAVADKSRSGLSLSLFVAAGNLGFAMAPLILVYFTETFSLTALPFLILPALVLSLFYYHSGLHREKTASSQNKAFHLKNLFKDAALVKLNLAMGLRAWTHAAVSTFLPLLLIGRGKDTTDAGIMLTIFLIGAAIGGMAGGFFNDRFGYKKVIIYSLMLGILPTYLFFSSAAFTPITIVYLFLCGASLQAPQPSSIVWAQKLLPNYGGMAAGMMMGLSFGLGGIGAAFTALLADYIGLSTALLLTTIPLGLGALIIVFTPKAK
jgi:FSR family fosmidomycin resistance protein-like MFS transporter